MAPEVVPPGPLCRHILRPLRLSIGEQVVSAIAAQDRGALAGCFTADCHFRALIPDGVRERDGPVSTADLISRWFADTSGLEVLASRSEHLGDRLHIWYRVTGIENGERYLVEQQLFCELRDGAIASAHLLCSGFRPALPRE